MRRARCRVDLGYASPAPTDANAVNLLRPIVLTALFLVTAQVAWAQNGTQPKSLRVFLDCGGRHTCDEEYIRTEIDYVDHVRDYTRSDVHLLVTTERTASGGESYTLAFLGQGAFAPLSDTLTVSILGTDTGNEQREKITRMIAVGLTPFLARTALAGRIRIEVDRNGHEPDQSVPVEDPWNAWIFSLGFSGSFESEESTKQYSTRNDVWANRTTEDWKVRLGTRIRYELEKYQVEDGEETDEQLDGSLTAFVAKSLGPHWSVGASVSGNTSSRENTDYSVGGHPTVEYNIFPYSESTRRELRLQYRIGAEYVRYADTTKYLLIDETLLAQGFEVRLDLRQPWGGSWGSFELKHYLTNFDESRLKFYSIEIDGGINLRIVRGLSVRMQAGVEFIHDQLYLPESEASDVDILLGRVRLPTDIAFQFEAGLSYTFGSIFNNVVNPRFGF